MRVGMLVALVGLMMAGPAAAQFVAPGGTIPVVANNPGENGTFWRSDVSILNVGESDTAVVMMLFPEIVNGEADFEMIVSDQRSIPAGTQVTLSNIVQSVFGLYDAKGALSVLPVGANASLVVSSRVYTFGDAQCEGSYGQDVSSVLVSGRAWASGLAHDGFFRTNIGIFLPVSPIPGSTTQFTVEIFDADGELAGSGFVNFDEAGLQQKSLSSFGVSMLVDGYAVISSSDVSAAWYGYASRVDQTSGDAVFRVARGYLWD